MQLSTLVFLGLVGAACATERVFIPLAPQAVKFVSSETIKSSQIGDVLSSILGFTVKPSDPWNSLAPVNPFKVPKTTLVLDFDGFDGDTTLDVSGKNFPLENDASLQQQLELLSERTLERFAEQEPVVLYMKTGEKLYGAKMAYPELLLTVSPEVDSRLKEAVKDVELSKVLRDGTFNVSLPGDDQFAVELHTAKLMLEQLSRQATKSATAPSVVWLRLSGLRHVVDRYTEESYQASHALRLIREFVDKVSQSTLKKAYGDKALLVVITQNDKMTGPIRKARSLLAAEDEKEAAQSGEGAGAAAPAAKDGNSWNLATPWDHEAHVAFVMIGFVLLLLALALFGISVGLWFMDPGRDSIIYRMTTQRMKRD
ncbi:renin receptor-like [Dermacentor silvarum]|uniref:renin receptor-like n=1 Tax=Dermacentor silvarum TaxID=543639 RepID=UPI00189782C5|nr:renin receptor-like [Dermacentor silvarum]